MSQALLITSSDFMPLREDSEAMAGALQAVEDAVVAQQQERVRQYNIVDRRPGEFEGIRLSLSAGDGLFSGLRIFGNPPHTRAFMLFDDETRAIVALIDYGVLNSLRVGAIAGVAARHLAPKGAKTMGLIGSGWQAPPQVLAVKGGVPTLERIRVFSPTPDHREAFAAQMTGRLGIPVEPVASVQEALADADIVDLCAPGHHDERQPLFDSEWVKPGALVVSMGANQITPQFAKRSRIVASWQSIMHPAPRPPYDTLVADGFSEADMTPLGFFAQGHDEPRRSPDENVIYQLEGGTAHDLFIATWGYEWARSHGLGTPFDLSA